MTLEMRRAASVGGPSIVVPWRDKIPRARQPTLIPQEARIQLTDAGDRGD
jgi:hypothetical protein